MRASVLLAAALALLATNAVATNAHAQDAAPPIEGGSTERTKVSGQLGGSWSTGNSKSYSVNFQTRLSHRQGKHEITWSGILNYGHATAQHLEDEDDPDAPSHTFKTDSLYYTRARYDFFFLERNALFVGLLGFRDTASGFRSRISPYAGYQHMWIASEPFAFWTDVGYRLAREVLFLDREARAEGFAERRYVHGPLLTLGMSSEINKTLDLDIAVEAQQSLNREKDFRVFSTTNLTNRIGQGFSLGMNFNLRYNREAIGSRSPLDTQLQVVAILDHVIERGKGGK